MSRLAHHTPNYKDSIGGFGAAYHLEMIKDSERVRLCKEAIRYTLSKDSTFCELGCGSGIFTIYAASLCKRVIAVEKDSKMISIAKHNAEKAGVAHKIKFINEDVLNLKNIDADVFFCEMLSIWLVNEPQVLIMNHIINNFYTKNSAFIPHRIINLFELGNYLYEIDSITIKSTIAQFTGIPSPSIMSESKVFNTINLKEYNDVIIDQSVKINPLVKGIINCIRLSSIVELTEGINFYSTDTLMPKTIVPLKSEYHVANLGELTFSAKYRHRTNLEESIFSIK